MNKIYNGDCLKVMPEIEAESVDMVLCDLPYVITDCAWDKIIPIDALWKQYNRIIKPHGAIVLTATMKFAIDLINANRKYFRYDLVWAKSLKVGFANAKRMPLRRHENLLVFYKHLPIYNPQGLKKLEKTTSKRGSTSAKEDIYSDLRKEYTATHTGYPDSILNFPNGNNGNVHPTQKPIALFEYLIKTYTNPGDVVLDNCIGSGTTAVAAINTERQFIGIEADGKYCNIAKERIKETEQL
ncbi:methyltransferase [Clostridia bacterium]|nr:methyltransferase [Clostridia bacterium]